MWKPVMPVAQSPAAEAVAVAPAKGARAIAAAAKLQGEHSLISRDVQPPATTLVPTGAADSVTGARRTLSSAVHMSADYPPAATSRSAARGAVTFGVVLPTAAAGGSAAAAAACAGRSRATPGPPSAAAAGKAAGTAAATATCPAAAVLIPSKAPRLADAAAAAPSLLMSSSLKRRNGESGGALKEENDRLCKDLEEEIYAVASEVRDPEFPTFSLGDLGVVTPELVCVTKQPLINCESRGPTSRRRSRATSSSSKDYIYKSNTASGSSRSSSRTSNSSRLSERTTPTINDSSESTRSSRRDSGSRRRYSSSNHYRRSLTLAGSNDWNVSSTRASSISSRRCSITSTNSRTKGEQRRRGQKPRSVDSSHRSSRKTSSRQRLATARNWSSETHSQVGSNADNSRSNTKGRVVRHSSEGSAAQELTERRQACRGSRMAEGGKSSSADRWSSRSRTSSIESDEAGARGNSREKEQQGDETAAHVATVALKPTNARCSLASLIGLAVRCKLEQHFLPTSPLLTLWLQQQREKESSLLSVQQETGEAQYGVRLEREQQERHLRHQVVRLTQQQQHDHAEAENAQVAVEASGVGAAANDVSVCHEGRQESVFLGCREPSTQGEGRRQRLHLDLKVIEHEDAAALTKQLNDKERCCAALEGNAAITELIWAATEEDRPDA